MLSQADRDALIEEHLEYARRLALRLYADVKPPIDVDELIAAARRGLVEAATRFDPDRGVAFTTFAYYRVRGAAFDALRRGSWLNRTEYAKFRAASDDYLAERHAQGAAASASSAEASSTEDAVAEITNALANVATIFVVSADTRYIDDTVPATEPGPEEGVLNLEGRAAVRLAIDKLPEREGRLIKMMYFRGSSMVEAGRVLGIHKSWASRLHARAIRRLTKALDPNES